MQLKLAWAAVLLIVGCLGAQEGTPSYAEVTGDRVRVRGGPADFHAVVGSMRAGTIVRVVGSEGDWTRVEIPGGFPVYVSLGQADKPYLREPDVGEGIVLVNDLMVRGTPDLDFPPIGRLSASDRVVILSKTEGWAQLLSPEGTTSYLHGSFLKPVDDPIAAAATWTQRHQEARRALLGAGELSKDLVTREAVREKRAATAREAFAAYDAERTKPWAQRDVASVRRSLSKVIEESPEGSADRVRAEALVSTVDEWERAGSALAGARDEFEEAARDARLAEERYAGTLKTLRAQVEKLSTSSETEAPKGPYRTKGYVRRVLPVPGIFSGPGYDLHMGGTRLFYLRSPRYALSEFEGKLVEIVSDKGPESVGPAQGRMLEVTRIEILDPQ
jgi:uncharacterized protein YgiM (DUF1202 family)